jgi:hypothetical protein
MDVCPSTWIRQAAAVVVACPVGGAGSGVFGRRRRERGGTRPTVVVRGLSHLFTTESRNAGGQRRPLGAGAPEVNSRRHRLEGAIDMKTTLSLGTAIVLLAATGVAYAGSSNTVYIDQQGSANTASVQQSAGPGGNDIGLPGAPLLQDGNNNSFTETQATGGGFSRGDNDILAAKQLGDNNAFSDYYSNNAGGNRINNVLQDGNHNTLSVERNAGLNSTVGTVKQVGDWDWIAIRQSGGTGNVVSLVQQLGSHNGASGVNLHNWGTYISQSGSNNAVDESTINGSNNNPSISSVGGPVHQITQTGNGNGQSFSTAVTNGSGGNAIHVAETGDGNNFSVVQGTSSASTGNYATVTQTGSSNDATATQFGNYNQLVVSQLADGNSSTTNFSGDSNGVGTLTGAAGALTNVNLVQGSVYQDSTGAGGGNSLTYNVTGSSNLFAFAQLGHGNTIDGTVGGLSASSNNQVAVLQASSGNTASFSQSGAGSNNLAISQ